MRFVIMFNNSEFYLIFLELYLLVFEIGAYCGCTCPWPYLLGFMGCIYSTHTHIQTHTNTFTGCNRRNGPNFWRMFLMFNYSEKNQNAYIHSWKVREIMANWMLWTSFESTNDSLESYLIQFTGATCYWSSREMHIPAFPLKVIQYSLSCLTLW